MKFRVFLMLLVLLLASSKMSNLSGQIIDTDGDGLEDSDEINIYGTDPFIFDTDGDFLGDGDEVLVYGTDPLNYDTDGDLLSDGDEILNFGTDPFSFDTDGDSLSDFDELNGIYNGTDTFYTNPTLWDTDGDTFGDWDEIFNYFTHPEFPNDVYAPVDFIDASPPMNENDVTARFLEYGVSGPFSIHTLTDVDWFQIYLVANVPYQIFLSSTYNPDTMLELYGPSVNLITTNDDYYGLLSRIDYMPTTSGYYLIKVSGFNSNWLINNYNVNYFSSTFDSDGDGLLDLDELFIYGTDYSDYDTDRDYINDYDEIFNSATDPLNPDTDGDEAIDGMELYHYLTDPLDSGFYLNMNFYDWDGDGLTDYDEFYLYGTDLLFWDTDGDTFGDEYEVSSGSDPNSGYDVPAISDAWEPDDTDVGASYIGLGSTGSHTIDVLGDQDWFYFDITTSGYYNIFTTSSYNADTTIYLYSSTDTTNWITSNDDTVLTTDFYLLSLLNVSLSPSTYYVRVTAYNDVYKINNYQLNIYQDGSDFDSDGLSDLHEKMVYQTAYDQFDTDLDFISDYDEVNGVFGYITDPTYWDTDGDQISDYDELFAFYGYYTDPTNGDTDGDGWYDYDEIMYGSDPTNLNSYPIFPDPYEDDNYPEFGEYLYAGFYSGEHSLHDSADVDYFIFELTESQNIEIITDGIPNGDTYISLLDDTYTEIAYDDNGNYDFYSRIEIVLTPGIYYIGVSAYLGSVEYYWVKFNTLGFGPDSYENDNDPALSEFVNTGGSSGMHSIHAADDIDWFSFTIIEQSNVILTTDGVLYGDTYMELFDSNLNPLAFNDDRFEDFYSRIEIVLNSGDYYVAITGYEGAFVEEYYLFVEAIPNVPSSPPPSTPSTPSTPTSSSDPSNPSTPPEDSDNSSQPSLPVPIAITPILASIFALAMIQFYRRR